MNQNVKHSKSLNQLGSDSSNIVMPFGSSHKTNFCSTNDFIVTAVTINPIRIWQSPPFQIHQLICIYNNGIIIIKSNAKWGNYLNCLMKLKWSDTFIWQKRFDVYYTLNLCALIRLYETCIFPLFISALPIGWYDWTHNKMKDKAWSVFFQLRVYHLFKSRMILRFNPTFFGWIQIVTFV